MYDRTFIDTASTKACVVGLIPQKLLHGANQETDATLGGIDASSGCAYFIHPDTNTGTAQVSIWNQEISPVFVEEMYPEISPVVHFVHPDYRQPEGDIYRGTNLVLTQSKMRFTYSKKDGHTEEMYEGLSLFWVSPSGHICYWNDISDSDKVCDVSIILPLMENEYVTCVALKETSTSWLYLIGTSEKRTWQVWKNNRPLELQARVLLSDDMHNYVEIKPSEGILSGIYSKIFTPSKSLKPLMEQMTSGIDDKSIMQIFDLAKATSTSSPSPAKMKKLSHPSSRSGGNSFLYTVSRNGSIQTWLSKYNAIENMHVGQNVHHLHLSSCLSSQGKMIHDLEVLAADFDHYEGSASISVCIKCCISDVHKLFLIHLPIDVDSGRLSFGSCAWLSRFSSQTLSSTSNLFRCNGLVATMRESRKTRVYCSFQAERSGSYPVTVTSVVFLPESKSEPQPIDVDLPEHIIREVVPRTLQYDNYNDGCTFISNQGCVIQLVNMDRYDVTPSHLNSIPLNSGMVDVLANHVFGEFRSHMRRAAEHVSHVISSPRFESSSPFSKNANSFLPQSITTSDNNTLSEAVVRVSAQLMDDNGLSSSENKIEEKIFMHNRFLEWLHRSGIFKRITVKGRISLCDHGEKLSVVNYLLVNGSNILENISDGLIDSHKILLNHFLSNIQDSISVLPKELLILQQSIQLNSDSVAVELLLELCSSIAYHAKLYRENKSCRMYEVNQDVSNYHSHKVFPWSSLETILTVFRSCMHLILKSPSKLTYEATQKVIIISEMLLDGHKNVYPSSRNEAEYHDSKRVIYELLSENLNEISNPKDDLAYSLSLQHCYFHGVVQTCQNHAKFGVYDPSYDLRALMQSSTGKIDHQAKDFETGLCFQKFTLRWYVDRNMHGTALSIGQECPKVLLEYMDEDERLSHLQWIQQVKNMNYLAVSKSLWSLRSEGISSYSDHSVTLDGKKLVLSLAKIASLCTNSPTKVLYSIIDDDLQLCRCQEGIAQIIVVNEISLELPRKPLDSESLMKLAIQLSTSVCNKESISSACLIGLSISKVMSGDSSINNDHRLDQTRDLWFASVNADVKTWEYLSSEWNILSEKDIMGHLKSTVFCQVAKAVEIENVSDTIGLNLVSESIEQMINIVGIKRVLQESIILLRKQ